jgi:hypothetical protein
MDRLACKCILDEGLTFCKKTTQKIATALAADTSGQTIKLSVAMSVQRDIEKMLDRLEKKIEAHKKYKRPYARMVAENSKFYVINASIGESPLQTNPWDIGKLHSERDQPAKKKKKSKKA